MGFYMYITCPLEICNETGRHYYYAGLQKVYTMPPDVPEPYRSYVKMKGKIYRIYAQLVSDDMSICVEDFAGNFPEWSEVVDCHDYEGCSESWSLEKHDDFRSALKWFATQDTSYMVSWCN